MRGCHTSSAALVAFLGTVLSACAPNNLCPCAPCGSAVTLTVLEAGTGLALNAFNVDVTFNGSSLGEPGECDATFRGDTNVCSFGFNPGLYQLVVTSPGHQPREASVRLADQEGAECCGNTGIPSCLRAKTVDLDLEPLR